ncbi:MAG: ABC transporter permease, partial [Actinobacteria bacterium]|nr:ABC transporter permease [Actinomycetota bacterium]
VGGRRFIVSGLVSGFTMAAGIPVVYAPIADAQALAFGGQPLLSAIVTRGVPQEAPDGFVVLENQDGIDDALRPLANGIKSLDNSTLFLWVVAAIIIGTIVYLTTLERLRDFAVLKAIGASSRDLFKGLALQAVIVAIAAATLASAVAYLLVPLFPLPVEIPARAFAMLPVVAVAVGLLASLSGLQRAISVDPARAFGGP